MDNSRPPRLLCGIIGHPLGHSLSPLLHNAAMAEHDLAGGYYAWPLPADKLPSFMAGMRTLPVHGVSVTIPHKQAVLPFLDRVTDVGDRVGAVNTLYWDDGELVGDNTDVTGFSAPLTGISRPDSALVLGAGGVARAALAGLAEIGVVRVGIANRTAAKAQLLAKESNALFVPWEERASFAPKLLVNATPLGMQGAMENETPWPRQWFDSSMVAYDLVYNPVETRFLRQARRAGCTVIDGVEMFVQQAAAQFGRFTGCTMDVAAARERVMKALLA